jgi:threonine dehydratase
MIPYTWLEQASRRINPYIQKTPLTYDAANQLYLKWENHQVTGSFKVRGALNKILSLQDWELERGLVTASAGNHGQGVALAAGIKHAHVMVFASEHALTNKLDAMRKFGAEIQLVPGGYGEAEHAAIAYARATGVSWISPYNDGMVIAGQGTIALEILQDLPDPSMVTWVVPAGGGGLISGIGTALQKLIPAPKLVAVQSEASPFLYKIYHHGSQESVVELPSIADGLAGPVEQGSVTIPMVTNLVTEFLLVTEAQIRAAIKYAWDTYHEQIEGSAAAALAAIISDRVADKPALVVITGGNIPQVDHARIIAVDNTSTSGGEKTDEHISR